MDVRTRRQRIIEALDQSDQVQVAALAETLGCSEMTVRRDLETLERGGVLRRVHGGALRSDLSAEETPYAQRALGRPDAKAAIGTAAADLLSDGETVILDGGTTAIEVARSLCGRRMTIMPLALRPVFELHECPGIRLLLPGGEVRAGELSLVGNLTEPAFSALRFDTYVMSACGLDADAGVTAHLLAETAVKRAAAKASRRVIVLADSSKLGRVAFGHICDIDDIDILVTDAEADETVLEELTRDGLQVRLVSLEATAT